MRFQLVLHWPLSPLSGFDELLSVEELFPAQPFSFVTDLHGNF
jgi:hypothetical protein